MSELKRSESGEEKAKPNRSEQLAVLSRFVGSLIVLVLGALMLADGTVKMVTGNAIFFQGVDSGFEFTIGFIVIILTASIMSVNRSELFQSALV